MRCDICSCWGRFIAGAVHASSDGLVGWEMERVEGRTSCAMDWIGYGQQTSQQEPGQHLHINTSVMMLLGGQCKSGVEKARHHRRWDVSYPAFHQ